MEDRDLQLIKELVIKNEELKKLWDEHLDLKEKLNAFNKKVYLSAEEEIKRREMQKLKLAGKDKIEIILRKYRAEN